MDRQELVDSIAYCGLICGKCHLSEACDGCRSTASLCERGSVCYQRKCCIERGLNGCRECSDFPCGKDMFASPHDVRIRAFVAFIQDEGAETLIDCVLGNEARGIRYGKGLDYDGLTSEEEVFRILRTGRRT